MSTHGFIDTDSHAVEPDDLWAKYLEPKYRDEAPVVRVGYSQVESGFGFFNSVSVGGYDMPVGFHGVTEVMPDLGEAYDDYARAGFGADSYIDAMDAHRRRLHGVVPVGRALHEPSAKYQGRCRRCVQSCLQQLAARLLL